MPLPVYTTYMRAGTVAFEPIYFFGHQDHTSQSIFVTIQTNATTLTMTPDHYIPACTTPSSGCRSWSSFTTVPASSVRAGQAVMVVSSGEIDKADKARLSAQCRRYLMSCARQATSNLLREWGTVPARHEQRLG